MLQPRSTWNWSPRAARAIRACSRSLDRTVTPMGGRRLRTWILQPIRDLDGTRVPSAIHRRSPAGAGSARVAARRSLQTIRDLERASGRLSQASGNARDLVALKVSSNRFRSSKRELQTLLDRLAFGANRAQESSGTESARGASAEGTARDAGAGSEVRPRAGRHSPLALKDGGIFRDGFDLRPRRAATGLARRENLDQPNCRNGKSRAPGSSP